MQDMVTMMDKAIGLAVLAVVIAGVAIPVVSDVIVTETTSITNRTVNSPTGSTPELLELDGAGVGVVDNSRFQVFLKDAHNGSVIDITADVNILPDYSGDDLNVTDVPQVNTTADQYNITADLKPEGYQGGTLGTLLTYVIVGIGLALLVAGFQFARF